MKVSYNKKVEVERNLEDVRKVYTGKPGCMCGCLGKYSYPTKQQTECEERGGTLSDRSVRIIWNKVMNNTTAEHEESYSCVETDNRILVVYFG